MNKSITFFSRIFSGVMAVLTFYSCNPGTPKTGSCFPKNGALCLQSASSGAEFIQMEFTNGHVEGKILTEEDVYGKVYYAFTGQIISDSVLQVSIAYSTDDLSREWVFHKNGDAFSIKNFLDRNETTNYKTVKCNAVAPFSDYASVKEVADDEDAEESENNPSLCFECLYPEGNKHIVFREYIRLKNENGQVSGTGAGYSEGDPEWSFAFSGSIVNDTVLELKADYKQDGISPFSTSETWILDIEKGRLRMKENKPENLRSTSNGEYHKINCGAIPEGLVTLMNEQKQPNE